MRISDWSSDVCSSDLRRGAPPLVCSLHQPCQTAPFVTTFDPTERARFLRSFTARVPETRITVPMITRVTPAAMTPTLFQYPESVMNLTNLSTGTGMTSTTMRSEEHKSELQSLMRISY